MSKPHRDLDPGKGTRLLRFYNRAVSDSFDRAIGNVFGGEAERLVVFDERPVDFGVEVLGHTYWDAQEYILNALAKYKRVAIRGCRKSTKTFIAGDAVSYMMSTAPTVCLTTASVGRQVRDQIWARIRKNKTDARIPLPGQMGVTAWRVSPEWFAIGMSTDRPENILGFHAGLTPPEDLENAEEYTGSDSPPDVTRTGVSGKEEFEDALSLFRAKRGHRLFILIDEASGVDPEIFDALEGSLAGDNVYCMVQGNPTLSHDSPHPFVRMFNEGSGWHRVHIGADEPGHDPTGSDKCFHSVPEWVIPAGWTEKAYGGDRESPAYKVFVLGLFAAGSEERLFVPYRLLVEAEERWKCVETPTVDGYHIGVDVARHGSDKSVAALNVAGKLCAEHEWQTDDLMETAGIILELMTKWAPEGKRIPARNVHVDIGMGAGVIDRLKQTGHYVDAVDFGERARYDWTHLTGEMRFLNRKSELHWVVRRTMEEGQSCIPRKYTEVWRQAQWCTYDFAEKLGGTEIKMGESKEDIRKAHKRSPDNWDAWVISFSRSSRLPSYTVTSSFNKLRTSNRPLSQRGR